MTVKKVNIIFIVILGILAIIMPTIIDVINKIIFYKEGEKKQKTFTKNNCKRYILQAGRRRVFAMKLQKARAFSFLAQRKKRSGSEGLCKY